MTFRMQLRAITINFLFIFLLAFFVQAAEDKQPTDQTTPALKPAPEATTPAVEPAKPAAPEPGASLTAVPAALEPAKPAALDPSTVLVNINGATITEADLTKKMLELQKMFESRGLPQDRFQAMADRLRPQIIEELVTLSLINQAAEAKKINVTDADLTEAIAQLRFALPPGVSYESVIEESGMSKADFEAMMKEQLLPQLKVERLLDIKQATVEEMQEFYKEHQKMFEIPVGVRARHILIGVTEEDNNDVKADKKKKAEDILKQLVEDKADFAKLAEAHSSCPSKAKGGDLGFFGKGQMVPEFETAAFALEKDGISKVVETPFGFHIIQTTEKREGKALSFDEAKESIAIILRRKQVGDKVEDMIKELHDKAKIEYTKEAKLSAAFDDDDMPIIMPAPTAAE